MPRVNSHGVFVRGGLLINLVTRQEAPLVGTTWCGVEKRSRVLLVETNKDGRRRWGEVSVRLYQHEGRWYHAGHVEWGGISVGSGGYLWPAVVGVKPFDTMEEALEDARMEAERALRSAARNHAATAGGQFAGAVLTALLQPTLFDLSGVEAEVEAEEVRDDQGNP